MDDRLMPAPVRVTGPAAWRWALRFGLDPLMATRRAHAAFGPFIVLAEALPFIRRPRAPLLNVPLVLTAGAAFNRELLSDPETWRGVSLLPGGPRNSAESGSIRILAVLPNPAPRMKRHSRESSGGPTGP